MSEEEIEIAIPGYFEREDGTYFGTVSVSYPKDMVSDETRDRIIKSINEALRAGSRGV